MTRLLRYLLCLSVLVGGSLPVAGPPRPRVIVIDPGHGGSQPAGTDALRNLSSPNNAASPKQRLKEKDLTLDLALRIAKRIESGDAAKEGRVKVVLTRDSDVNLDFGKRAGTASKAGADCFVAIHFNADSGKAGGPRAVIQQESRNPNFAADRAFALALARAVEGVSRTVRSETPKAMVHDDHYLHNGWGSYLFHQLNLNPATRQIPACHLEVEFLDNAEIEKILFVEKREEVFSAWAGAIAAELLRQVR